MVFLNNNKQKINFNFTGIFTGINFINNLPQKKNKINKMFALKLYVSTHITHKFLLLHCLSLGAFYLELFIFFLKKR